MTAQDSHFIASGTSAELSKVVIWKKQVSWCHLWCEDCTDPVKTKKAIRTPEHEWSFVWAITIMITLLLLMLYWTQWFWIPMALQVGRIFYNVENELIETAGNKVHVKCHE